MLAITTCVTAGNGLGLEKSSLMAEESECYKIFV